MSTIRESLVEMEKVLTRRAFFLRLGKAAGGLGVAAVYDRFGPALFGQATPTGKATLAQVLPIFRAFGKLVIPVDEDPGWETFEPGISEYALDVYIRQVFALGNNLAFDGLLQAMNGFNEYPPQVGYGPKFLNMNDRAKGDYLTNVLVSNFENDGVQDVLSFGGIFMLLGVKQVFFQNYPHHLPDLNAEFQVVSGFSPKSGWDIMRFKGPVGAEEEKALRARTENAPELPGVDWRNPWI